jgi:hypothetical protein
MEEPKHVLLILPASEFMAFCFSTTIYFNILGDNIQREQKNYEAVSCWLPTAAARVRARVWQVEFLTSGQVFSEYIGFPCQNRSFHQLLHHHNHP